VQLGQQLLRLGAHPRLVRLRRLGVELQQDVRGAPLLGARGIGHILLVIGAQIVFGDGNASGHRFQIEHHVLDARLLGGAKVVGMLLIKRL
jgi:hypothetical protein